MNHPNRNKPLTMEIGDHVRQGDVLIRKVSDIPASAREMKRDEHGRIVLAHGEKTGHAHAFRNKGICSFTTLDNEDVEFLLVGGGGTINHELVSGKKAEHNPIIVPDGKYECAQQIAYSPAELVRVAD